jgi:spermidine/putrescine transport system ATP-binding protein
MRAELKQIQARTGITFVYITHDQGEALTMSNRVAVMNRGRIMQTGTPDDVYDRPDSAFVATFVGEMNAVDGKVVTALDRVALVETPLGRFRAANPKGLGPGDEAILFVRPEKMRLLNAGEDEDNSIAARVTRRDMEGAWSTVVAQAEGRELRLHLPHSGRDTPPSGEVTLGFSADAGVILPKGEMSDD